MLQVKILIGCCLLLFNLNVYSQTTYSGKYSRTIELNKGGQISYDLSLNNDQTFDFIYIRQLGATAPKEQTFSKGIWGRLDDNKIELTTSESLIGAKDALDLTNSKAHYITKSSRDKSNRVLPTYLKFYDSKVPWVKGIQLFKN